MLQRIVLVLVIIMFLAVIGVGLRMFITQRYKTVSPEDFARNVESLKNQGAAMEQEAIAAQLEEELVAARDEAAQQRMRAEEYDRFLDAILSGEVASSSDGQPRTPGELLLVLRARLAQEPEPNPEQAAEIQDRIAKLQAEVTAGTGPVCLRGAVRRPGVYMPPVEGVMTLSQLLKAAGGVDGGQDAAFSVRVFRTPHDPGQPVFFVVAESVDDIADDDFNLAPNDVVLIEMADEESEQ